MARRKLAADIVDVQEILVRLCDKWSLLILQQLSRGTRRHGELQRAIPGVSQKMLTETLRKLEQDRLVRRTVRARVPRRVDYALTSLGGTLTTPLDVLYRWTKDNLKEIRRARRAAPEPGPGVGTTAPS